MTSPLCIAPGCQLPRRHTPTCDGTSRRHPDEDCPGCLPAQAEVGQLCQRDLNHTTAVLLDIAELYERLTQLAAGWPAATAAHDPLSASLPAGPISHTSGPKVSGTPGRSTPTSLDILDLLAPSRLASVHDDWHDQTGHPSVATKLHLWARDWHTRIGHNLPDPTVPDLIRWLHARLDWATHHHPALVDFIREIGDLRTRLYGVLHEREPQPEHCLGIACRRCNERGLYRRADGTGDVDCHSCGLILRAAEYADYTHRIATTGRRAHAEALKLVRARHAERDGRCPTCGAKTDVHEQDVVLVHAAPGSWAESLVRVRFGCRCEVLMTPAIA